MAPLPIVYVFCLVLVSSAVGDDDRNSTAGFSDFSSWDPTCAHQRYSSKKCLQAGERQYIDRKVADLVKSEGAVMGRANTVNYTYTVPYYVPGVLNYVEMINLFRPHHFAYITWLEGGPGYRFIKVNMKSQVSDVMNYSFKAYTTR